MRIGDANIQALQAFGIGQQVSANNVANMNTEGFDASRITYETGPEGQGVRVQDIQPISTPGPIISTADLTAGRDDNAGNRLEPVADVELSNTDLPREMTNMIVNETAYAANAQAIVASDDMQGTVIDMMA